jgi:hypothetical protein
MVAPMMRTGALDPDTIGRTARHLAAVTYCRPGHARSAAEAAIESLHTRAQRRAERRHRTETVMSVRSRTITAT